MFTSRRLAAFLTLGVILGQPVLAAPLFPDVKEDHWAKDAVAALAAKGLLEGYPDGTFKGDRAASRWEVAMIVARLLAKMEQSNATFATKAELDDLRKLANSLKDELDALGIRVTNLEEQTSRLDRRVTELERITFYGSLDARGTSITLRNVGASAERSLNPGVVVNTIDYNAAVGSVVGAGGAAPAVSGLNIPPTFNPFTNGPLTTTNWQTGQPLVSGTGFTAKATLGVKVKVSDEVDAGIEFAAYTSQGNSVVDAYYGVNAPYLSNPFTATTTVTGGLAGLEAANNTPFTNMVLDHFWVRHIPSDTTITIGAFNGTGFDPSVYGGMINPNMTGPTFLDNFGLDAHGLIHFGDDIKLRWEVMGTKLPDGNLGALPGEPGYGSSYFSHAEGGNLKLLFADERGNVKINFLHAADDASGGAPEQVGLLQQTNLILNWVNPAGYYINQLGGAGSSAVAGLGSTSDKRPVPMFAGLGNDGSLAAQVQAGIYPQSIPNVGGIGPQDQTTLGASVGYKWDTSWEPRFYGDFAHSIYSPNKNSDYTTTGNAWRVGAGAVLLDKTIDVDVRYIDTDARFSPFVIQIPSVSGLSAPLWRVPDFNAYQDQFTLHDTTEYTNNREGVKAKVTWKFRPTGRITVDYADLWQVTSSLQDVRYSAGALGLATPNSPVLGYSPGFVDSVFGGFSPYTFAASGSNTLAIPLENPKGYNQHLYVLAGYKWLFDEANSNRGLTLSGGFKGEHFYRNSNLAELVPGGYGTQGEDVNYVNLSFQGFHIGLDYDVTENFTAKLGFTQIDIFGHDDPLGGSAQYAESIGFAKFTNVDMTQLFPSIGFEWRINDDLSWSADGRYYFTTDHVPAAQYVSPGLPALNIESGPNYAHPFDYNGLMLNTAMHLKF